MEMIGGGCVFGQKFVVHYGMVKTLSVTLFGIILLIPVYLFFKCLKNKDVKLNRV